MSEQFYHIVSGASLTGNQANQAIRSNKGYIQHGQGPGHAYANYAPDGLSSILAIFEKEVGFEPWNRNKNNQFAFNMLIQALSSEESFYSVKTRQPANPFRLGRSTKVVISRQSKSWVDALWMLGGVFNGFNQSDQSTIVKTMSNMARAAASHPNTANSTTLFIKHVIHAHNDELYLYLYYSLISLELDHHKGSTSWQENIEVFQNEFWFDKRIWANVAEQVIRGNVVSLGNWLNAHQSPHGNLNHKLNLPY